MSKVFVILVSRNWKSPCSNTSILSVRIWGFFSVTLILAAKMKEGLSVFRPAFMYMSLLFFHVFHGIKCLDKSITEDDICSSSVGKMHSRRASWKTHSQVRLQPRGTTSAIKGNSRDSLWSTPPRRSYRNRRQGSQNSTSSVYVWNMTRLKYFTHPHWE